MTGELERRWDDAMEGAWSGFRERLADRLAGMDVGSLLVQLPDDELLGAAPYCQVMVDEGWLRVEAVSNAFLDAQHELTDEQAVALVDLGFGEPEEDQSPNFWLDLEQREADRAAWLMVHALRHVYGVMHPIYLEADGIEPPALEAEPSEPDEPDDDAITFPRSSDELIEAWRTVVSDLVGRVALLDEDGDLPFPTDKAVLYVTASHQAPRVLLFGTLVTDVVDEQRALVEVNLLNKAEYGLTFMLNEGSISVRRELPMTVFVPDDARMELVRFRTDADRWVTELVTRVGGRSLVEDGPARPPSDRQRVPQPASPSDERFDQAVRVLRELEGEERGSVDVATLARIFHGDRDLLLEASRWALSRSSGWGERRCKAEKEGKVSFAKGCRAQQRYYHQLRGRIRQALRSVVQAPAKRERQAQLSLFSEDEASA